MGKLGAGKLTSDVIPTILLRVPAFPSPTWDPLMLHRPLSLRFAILAFVALCVAVPSVGADDEPQKEASSNDTPVRVFEMRTYVTHPGRLDALNKRFREHTNRLFEKHGMDLIGYWTPADGDGAKDTLVYILVYPSREAAQASWKAFRDDPEWKAAAAASEVDGKIVKSVDSKFLAPTDYSPIR